MKRAVILFLLLASTARAGSVAPFTTIFMRTLLDDADAATGRTTLGLGAGDSPTFTGLTLSGDTFVISTSKTPAGPSAAGTQGQIAWDTSYIYVCVAANTWKRVAISTWAVPDNVIFNAENVIFAGEQVVY